MTDSADLKAAVRRFVSAFSHLEWSAFSASFSSKASVFFPFNDTIERVDGTSAVMARFKAFFSEVRESRMGPDFLGLDPQNLLIEMVAGAALVTFHLRDGSRLGRRSMVWIVEDGQWKLRHLHASNMDHSIGDAPTQN